VVLGRLDRHAFTRHPVAGNAGLAKRTNKPGNGAGIFRVEFCRGTNASGDRGGVDMTLQANELQRVKRQASSRVTRQAETGSA